MYRIELSPGEETVFRSIEELAVAVKRGVVTPRARIYHNATSRWLPIQFHPHYKAALSMPLTQAALVAGPPVKPLSSLSLKQPTEAEPQLAASPEGPVLTATTEPPSKRKTSGSATPARTKRSRQVGKPRRQLRIALVGALLVGGAQWVLSAPLFSRTSAPQLLDAHRSLISLPAAAMKRVSSPNTAAMIPVLPSSSVSKPEAVKSEPPRPVRVSAPSFGGTSAVETGTAAPVEPLQTGIAPS